MPAPKDAHRAVDVADAVAGACLHVHLHLSRSLHRVPT
jgi:hypothetical protein